MWYEKQRLYVSGMTKTYPNMQGSTTSPLDLNKRQMSSTV